MSNFNEYIAKLECAYRTKRNIEQLELTLERMKYEYDEWVSEEICFPAWTIHCSSDSIWMMMIHARGKHELRMQKKERRERS